MRVQLVHNFENIIGVENLLEAWKEFVKGKRSKRDVQEFSRNLIDNILSLYFDFVNLRYTHGGYEAFNICDPKPRNIHKASVRDRLVHHAIYRTLYPFFDRIFISDSFSCRLGKGTHRALDRFEAFFNKVSRNNTRTVWVLKCDIRKFFANIDHELLIRILMSYIRDRKTLWLLRKVIESFSSTRRGIGLPLGNLTSQLFVNIYMNEFDQYMKHILKAKYYIRYADDFVILSHDRIWLEEYISKIREFLENRLHLQLHPHKVFIKTLASGVDFLGWVHFPDHRVLRGSTKRRMFARLKENLSEETKNSYLGILKHGNTHKIQKELFSELK